MDWTQHGNSPRIENDGGNSWKWLCSSQGLAHDDDDDDDDGGGGGDWWLLQHCYVVQGIPSRIVIASCCALQDEDHEVRMQINKPGQILPFFSGLVV